MTRGFWKKVATRAEVVFCRPSVLYAWDDIVSGVMVSPPGGPPRVMAAVSANTWRAHPRKDKGKEGSAAVYQRFFIANKESILTGLRNARNRQELHALANKITSQIKGRLTNTEDHVLASYNSLRKPVDLYLEHLVAMAEEVDPKTRSRLVPFLYLPLDSQILGSFPIPEEGEDYSLFTSQELKTRGLKVGSSYGHVTTETAYLDLQEIISRRAKEVAASAGVPFHPIYFDMLWNQRYARGGRNLFETNP